LPPPGSGGAHQARHAHAGGTARRGALRLTQVLASVLSIALLLGFGYGWYEYRSLNNGLQRLHLTNLAEPSPPTRTGTQPPQQHFEGTEQNILVVGVDSRDGLSPAERRLLSVGSDQSLSADTIMIIHVPADGSQATMISIPRDSYVDIPGGYLKNKINAAYADGYTYAESGSTDQQRQAAGANVLIGAVKELTGLDINHYIQVGFGGFYTIAKAIGTIPVNLCESTDDTLAYNEANGEGHVGSNFKMSAGHHELTPVQVVEFVRQRHNLVGGDLAREKRQRYFLTAAFNKIASAGVLLNPVKLNKLIKAVTGAFYVDDNGFSIADLATQMANLSASNITGYTIPIQGQGTATIAGQSQSVEFVDPARVQRYVARVLSGDVHKHVRGTSPAVSAPVSSAPPGSTGPPGTTATSAPAHASCIH
jgi:LCP family protein required for cell wall assembly